ncbi:MAG TPA: 3-oxoadipate enol-lactonase [Ramlibacter sp.]|nr:3-oxoadipate enol-lactonase [Ramlibacter sp.]
MPFIACEGARVFWRTDGRPDAPTLVLANSLGSDTSLWDRMLPALIRDFHVIRLDLPGHGASSISGPRAEWTIPELASHVLHVAEAAGAARFSFVGVSIGGMIGLWLAANTSRVQRLVASNTSATVDAAVWTERLRIAGDKGLSALVDGTMQRWFSAAFLASGSPELATIREHFLQVDPKGYIGCCAAIRDVDLHGNLQRITTPTLVISGTHDVAMPPVAGRAIASAIPKARYLELPVAHIPHIEKPDPFLEAVLQHLSFAD